MTQALPSVVPLLWCARPRAQIQWLQEAFGFEAGMIVAADGEGVIHSELTFGDGMIYVVGPPPPGDDGASPADVQGRNTQTVCMNLERDLDAHCERARAAGARIQREPADQPYGSRVYTCVDPEGHHWAFSQAIKAMTPQEMAAATGRRIETPETTHG